MSEKRDTVNRQMAVNALKSRAMCLYGVEGDKGETCKEAAQVIEALPSERNDRRGRLEDEEYCAECNHIEMCSWYPYDGCEFRDIGYKTIPDEKERKL